ncbi:hypothetical protein [Labrenzia sp. OB1]|uniref:hypothetical protein n=1 Tax=Labrenzia sp. OB1 TaxID=1561204 RepID=UPI001FCC1F17|nr:hypothetical protein [Labrenzia sp. OB1]
MGQYIERFEFADGTRLSQIAFQQDGFAELIGTSSSDWIAGTAGDDFLTGAGGADTFVFTETSGTDRVTDFTDGEDLIRIERSALTFEDLVLEASGTDALVRFDGSTIVLQGVDLSELDRGDFLFT